MSTNNPPEAKLSNGVMSVGEGSLIRTIGVNIGILVLFIGLFLSLYGNVLRARYMRQRRERDRRTAATDGGEPSEARRTSEDSRRSSSGSEGEHGDQADD